MSSSADLAMEVDTPEPDRDLYRDFAPNTKTKTEFCHRFYNFGFSGMSLEETIDVPNQENPPDLGYLRVMARAKCDEVGEANHSRFFFTCTQGGNSQRSKIAAGRCRTILRQMFDPPERCFIDQAITCFEDHDYYGIMEFKGYSKGRQSVPIVIATCLFSLDATEGAYIAYLCYKKGLQYSKDKFGASGGSKPTFEKLGIASIMVSLVQCVSFYKCRCLRLAICSNSSDGVMRFWRSLGFLECHDHRDWPESIVALAQEYGYDDADMNSIEIRPLLLSSEVIHCRLQMLQYMSNGFRVTDDDTMSDKFNESSSDDDDDEVIINLNHGKGIHISDDEMSDVASSSDCSSEYFLDPEDDVSSCGDLADIPPAPWKSSGPVRKKHSSTLKGKSSGVRNTSSNDSANKEMQFLQFLTIWTGLEFHKKRRSYIGYIGVGMTRQGQEIKEKLSTAYIENRSGLCRYFLRMIQQRKNRGICHSLPESFRKHQCAYAKMCVDEALYARFMIAYELEWSSLRFYRVEGNRSANRFQLLNMYRGQRDNFMDYVPKLWFYECLSPKSELGRMEAKALIKTCKKNFNVWHTIPAGKFTEKLCNVVEDAPKIVVKQQPGSPTCIFDSLANAFNYIGDKKAFQVILNNTKASIMCEKRIQFAIDLTRNSELRYNPVHLRDFDIFRDVSHFPTICVLLGSDDSTTHAVTVIDNWVFDANADRAMTLTIETLNWCVSTEHDNVKFCTVIQATRFKRNKALPVNNYVKP